MNCEHVSNYIINWLKIQLNENDEIVVKNDQIVDVT